MKSAAWICAASVLLAGGAEAARAPAPIPCARIAGGGGEVREVTGPLTFKLADGTEVALAELGLPGAPRPGASPAADAAREALDGLVRGRAVRLYYEPPPALREDRHGRRLAQVLIGVPGAADAAWLQARLVEDGAAFVDSWATNHACAATLLPPRGCCAGRCARSVGGRSQSTTFRRTGRRGARGVSPSSRARSSARRRSGRGSISIFPAIGGADSASRSTPGRRGCLRRPAPIRSPSKAGACACGGYVDWGSGPEIAATHPEMIETLGPAPALPF